MNTGGLAEERFDRLVGFLDPPSDPSVDDNGRSEGVLAAGLIDRFLPRDPASGPADAVIDHEAVLAARTTLRSAAEGRALRTGTDGDRGPVHYVGAAGLARTEAERLAEGDPARSEELTHHLRWFLTMDDNSFDACFTPWGEPTERFFESAREADQTRARFATTTPSTTDRRRARNRMG